MSLIPELERIIKWEEAALSLRLILRFPGGRVPIFGLSSW